MVKHKIFTNSFGFFYDVQNRFQILHLISFDFWDKFHKKKDGCHLFLGKSFLSPARVDFSRKKRGLNAANNDDDDDDNDSYEDDDDYGGIWEGIVKVCQRNGMLRNIWEHVGCNASPGPV